MTDRSTFDPPPGLRDPLAGLGDPVALDDLARSWWSVALRGIVAIIFGVAALLLPAAALLALVLLFGAYALVDGLMAVAAGVRRTEGKDWLMILSGLAGIFIGIVTPFLPGLTALVLVTLIGAWALITGALQLGAAFRSKLGGRVRMLLALDGILSIVLGGALLLFPGLGAVVLVYMAAAYALVSGVTLLVLALRLRERARGLAPAAARSSRATA
jgi:uncharacterized membrane protein HdeD (DUF308 family)